MSLIDWISRKAGRTRLVTAPGCRQLQGKPPAGREACLVFLHGRDEQHQDPEALRREWTTGLNSGLPSTATPVVAADVWFPFYGRLLADLLAEKNTPAPSARPAVLRTEAVKALQPAQRSSRRLYRELIARATATTRGQQGGFLARLKARLLSVLPWVTGRLQRELSELVALTPFDEIFIAAFLRDVAIYLDQDDVRRAVLECVRSGLPSSGPLIIVSHSFGTVVAMDLLAELEGKRDVRLLVTAGSPLGMDAIYERLLTKGPKRPADIGHWLNVWDQDDVVCLGCPLKGTESPWKGQVDEELQVSYQKSRVKGEVHDIAGYLANHDVQTGQPVAAIIEANL
jgi:endonuclease G, mitochondrial